MKITLTRISLTTIALASLCSVGAAQTTTTSTTSTRTFTFPPAGLASTETAQVNVVNTASNSSSGTAASCTGTISFVNASGAVIGSATSFTVTSGQIASVKLAGSGARAEVRGELTFTETTGSAAAPCSIVSSFETYDTTSGATHIYLTQENGPPNGGGFGPGR
jgi:hypothetical protein